MKTLLLFVAVIVCMAVLIPVFYYLSPQAELSGLRSENIQLRERLADAKADIVSDALLIVVGGMLAITALLMTGFFFVLCLLSEQRPMQFFSVGRDYDALPRAHGTGRQAIDRTEPEAMPEYYAHDDRYIMQIWEG